MDDVKLSKLAVIGGISVCLLVALAGVLFINEDGDSSQRLALLFGIIALVVPALIAMLRADQAKTQTNGALDGRIEAAVYRAQAVRRREVAEDLCNEPKDE